jgi:predicted nucleic acid-binding protein
MTSLNVVSDSTPLIALARINRFFLLQELFGEINIPPAVYYEVVIASKGRAGGKELKSANWIHSCEVINHDLVTFLKISLDDGEAEAIALAQETSADLLLMDDGEGRRIAESVGIKFTGTVGLLLRYYQGSYQDTKEALDELLAQGFRLSQKVYLKILEQIKE